MIHKVWLCCVALMGICLADRTASAQELLWSPLPEDGSWVRFRGTWKDIQERPESNEGQLELTWSSELTIKSVGREDVRIDGVSVPCRWIEFKAIIGYQSADGIQPGPYGLRIYKVLIPEKRVTGKLVDETNIPVTFLPIVKGFRKTGERDVVPIKEKVLVTYPNLALMPHYKKLVPEGEGDEELDLQQLGTVSAKHFKAQQTVETETTRSANEGELWLSSDMPFGLAKYRVKLIREEKEDTEPREEFRKVAELDVEMVAIEKGSNAASEIAEGEAPGEETPKVLKKSPSKEVPADEPAAPAEEGPSTPAESKEESAEGEKSADEAEETPAEEAEESAESTAEEK